MKANKTTREQKALTHHQRRKESSIDLAAHNQILKQKKLNGRNQHIPINTNIECQWTQLPHQKTPFGKLD
jgi:hypothetical protein